MFQHILTLNWEEILGEVAGWLALATSAITGITLGLKKLIQIFKKK